MRTSPGCATRIGGNRTAEPRVPQVMPTRSTLAAVLLLAGCALLPGTGDLDGDWTLLSGTHDGAALELIDGAPVTLTIDGAEARGQAACNSFSGSVTVSGARFRLHDLATTMMGCEAPIMALESAYHAALGAVSEARRTGDRLTLTGDGVELVYGLTPATPDVAMAGTDWRLETILQGDVAASAVDFDRVVMQFGADGTVEGRAGCLTWDGTWIQDPAGTIAVTLKAVLVVPCPPDQLSSAEDAVRIVVEDGFRAAIEGDRLIVEPEAGIGLAYRPAP